jgi:hypothetical protein
MGLPPPQASPWVHLRKGSIEKKVSKKLDYVDVMVCSYDENFMEVIILEVTVYE